MGWFRSILAALGLADEEPPMPFALDDADMREAARLAQESFGRFEERLGNPEPGDDGFLVKIRLPLEEDSVETVWAGDPSKDADGRWTARIESVPIAREHRVGDRIGFDPATIADWAYFSKHGLQGGFSQRVMISRMPERKRARKRAELGIPDVD